MIDYDMQLRQAERNAFCRGCDDEIQKGDDMVSFYSQRNRGMWVHLCVACSEKIGNLVKATDNPDEFYQTFDTEKFYNEHKSEIFVHAIYDLLRKFREHINNRDSIIVSMDFAAIVIIFCTDFKLYNEVKTKMKDGAYFVGGIGDTEIYGIAKKDD